MASPGYYIGLMSGTSMDSIDAALVQVDDNRPELLHTLSHPWPASLKFRLLKLASTEGCSLAEFGELDHLCGLQFAQAVYALLKTAAIPAAQIQAVGSHGQTIHHHPQPPHPFTLQIGDPNLIAEQTGIAVVADFRRRDMAAGGQGAPLVPAFHHALFSHPHRNRTVLNIGGIANITILPASGAEKSGFDTGPGNCLMDRWCMKRKGLAYDKGGAWAAQGKTNDALLQALMNDEYFRQPPPKSTGTEYFNPGWLEKKLQAFPGLADADIQASLLALTTSTIAQAIMRWAPDTDELLVCGGGVHNKVLMQNLAESLAPMKVISTDKSNPGLDPDWVEAAAFAWLAHQTLQGKAGSLPEATGASHPTVLGCIYPA